MDGKRAANGQHADEPDQKKAKTDGAAKPALNLVSEVYFRGIMFVTDVQQ